MTVIYKNQCVKLMAEIVIYGIFVSDQEGVIRTNHIDWKWGHERNQQLQPIAEVLLLERKTPSLKNKNKIIIKKSMTTEDELPQMD